MHIGETVEIGDRKVQVPEIAPREEPAEPVRQPEPVKVPERA